MNRGSDKYRLLIENMPDAFAFHQMVTDQEGYPVDYIFLEINGAFEDMTGLKREDVIGRKVTEVLPGIKKSEFNWIDSYGRVALTGKTFRFESYSEQLGRWYDVSAFSDKQGYFSVVFRDITSYKKIERDLLSEQREKEIILNNLAEQIAYLDPEMRIIWANSKVIGRHNLGNVKYRGQKCFDLYHQLDEPCPDCPVVEALKTGKPCSGIHKSPDDMYWQVNGIPVSGEKGDIIGVIDTALDVSELVKSKELVQANYALLRIAGKTARFGGWSVDLSSNICTWSDQVAEIHGMPAGYSPPLSEGISFYAPEWRGKITEVFTACAEEGIPYDEEMQIITASGQRVWVRAIGEAVRVESGKIIRVQGSFQDITELKKTEQALCESEERLDLAMAVKNEGIWDWNLLTNETYFDARYYTMAGYKPDEFTNSLNSWAERVHEGDLPKAQQAIDAYLKGKTDQLNIEFRFKKKDGQWMWINGKGKIYGRDENGSPLRMIGTHTDITDRKQAEAKLKKIEWMLSQKQTPDSVCQAEVHDQGYGDLTELNSDGIILKSIGSELLKSFSNDYMELLGTSSAIYEVNGDYAFGIFSSGWCQMMDCASRKLCNTIDNVEALNSGQWLCHESCWTDCSKEAILKHEQVDIECNGGMRIYAVPIFANGEVVGAINFGYSDPPEDREILQKLADAYHINYNDLVREAHTYDTRPSYIVEMAKKRLHATARLIGSMVETKQAEGAIHKLNEELEQRVKERTVQLEAVNKELETFAYSVSHDLRAPLRAMGGFSEVLQTEYSAKLDDQGKHYLERIRAAANRMGVLIDNLLILARVTRVDFQYETVDLSKVAAEILAELQAAEPERQVVADITTGMKTRGDKHLLYLAMENLLNNAWKFSSMNGQARIDVGQTIKDEDKCYFVRDNGAGFDMAYSDKLYVPFQRLHGTAEFPGTGIGLSIVFRIIKRHGGKVWAEGEVGRGANFYFTLPG